MSNICKVRKHYQHHLQSQAQHIFRKYVTTVQTNQITLFQECFEIYAFFMCTSVHIYKTTRPHEGNFRAERIINSDAQFLCVLC